MANPIEKYRAIQLRIRLILNPYTSRLCPECPTPCCRKPTKVSEFDVLLANSCGYSLPWTNESVTEMVNASIELLKGRNISESETEWCAYLGPDGCLFPGNLRPFQCVRYMCTRLKQEISPGELREIRALLHKLGVAYRKLLSAVYPKPNQEKS